MNKEISIMVSTVIKESTRTRLHPHRFHDDEQYYPVDWEQIKPEDCNLDYDCQEDHNGTFTEIFETNTGTVISRTRSFKDEEAAVNAAERILEFLRTEYYFEENNIWTRKT